jgi:dipeptide/tripeptide permease
MPLIKREWTPAEADSWTKEDWVAAILSVLAFILLALGTTYAFLLYPVGFVLLGAGAALGGLVFWIIDPKLTAVSGEYEKKQAEYVEQLERIVRWEDGDG